MDRSGLLKPGSGSAKELSKKPDPGFSHFPLNKKLVDLAVSADKCPTILTPP